MSKKLPIHTEGNPEPQHLEIEEHDTVEIVVHRLLTLEIFRGCRPEEIVVFEEDSEIELGLDYPIGKHRHKHFHGHRCRRIAVTVSFNGEANTNSYPPSARLRTVIDWAKSVYNIAPEQQCALREGPSSEPLDLDAHVGSFAAHDACSVKFYLAIIKGPQG